MNILFASGAGPLPAKRFRACAASLLAVACFAADFSALPSLGHVSDYAEVIDSGTETILKKYCSSIEESTGVRLELATVQSLGREPVEDVAPLLARQWGLADHGVLLLLVVRERLPRLQVGTQLEESIPTDYTSTLLNAMRPSLREGDHGNALLIAAQTLAQRLADAKGVTINPPPARRRVGGNRKPYFPWVLFAGGLALAAWLVWLLLRRRSRALTGPVRSGGGFGEYDSHDRSGGFGGASSKNW